MTRHSGQKDVESGAVEGYRLRGCIVVLQAESTFAHSG